jgi:hypothetical protein
MVVSTGEAVGQTVSTQLHQHEQLLLTSCVYCVHELGQTLSAWDSQSVKHCPSETFKSSSVTPCRQNPDQGSMRQRCRAHNCRLGKSPLSHEAADRAAEPAAEAATLLTESGDAMQTASVADFVSSIVS